MDDFFISFSSTDAFFKDYFSGTYFLPDQIILDGDYEIALDAFFSAYSFEEELFITINCDFFPNFLLNNQAINSCHILYFKNVNEQIYKNQYYRLQISVINSINISIQNLNFEDIIYDKKNFCLFKFHFRKKK